MLEIDLNAPPARVWQVLTDFSGYAAWNSQYVISGNAERFEKLRVTPQAIAGRAQLESTVFIWKIDPQKRLELVRGNLLLLGSKRIFQLAPSERGTLLRHGLSMVGLWSRIRFSDGAHLATFQQQLEVFQFDLKRSVEGKTSAPAKATKNRHMRRASEHRKTGPKA